MAARKPRKGQRSIMVKLASPFLGFQVQGVSWDGPIGATRQDGSWWPRTVVRPIGIPVRYYVVSSIPTKGPKNERKRERILYVHRFQLRPTNGGRCMNLNPFVICARGPNRLFIIAILSGHALTMNRDRVLELDKIVTLLGTSTASLPFSRRWKGLA